MLYFFEMEVKQKSGGEAEKLGKSKLRLWGAGVSEFFIFSKRYLLFNTGFFWECSPYNEFPKWNHIDQ